MLSLSHWFRQRATTISLLPICQPIYVRSTDLFQPYAAIPLITIDKPDEYVLRTSIVTVSRIQAVSAVVNARHSSRLPFYSLPQMHVASLHYAVWCCKLNHLYNSSEPLLHAVAHSYGSILSGAYIYIYIYSAKCILFFSFIQSIRIFNKRIEISMFFSY